ncbi:probable plastid-lipid-associated protein 12, chloroplastic isoform X3 [Miscanthus floridulus]|uniref:probable plastid-lipid-associated protein 12, chloroplastic isoform X3 n=1 Tax=Miscanthus floridulus TaxID=154761 RepID=UPI0034578406
MATAPAAPGGLMHLRPPPPRCVSPRASASRAPRIWGTPPRLRLRRRRALALGAPSVASAEAEAYTEPELVLLEALLGVQGRGRAVAPRQLQEVESAVQALEALGGVPDPTSSSLIEGSWQLIFTTRPGTASPIQRTFVGVDSFRIFQEVYLRTDDPRVVNVVKFSESVGDLKVEGTTFVLQKSADPRQILLSAISARTGVEEVINDFISSQNGTKTDLSILVGEWQLLWSSQTEGESWSSVASAGLKDFQIIKEDGKLKNSASPFPSLTLNATGNICKKGSGNTFTVSMKEGAVQVGGLQFPLDAQGEFVMEILYIDNKIRISRLNQHMLVHLRIANT